MNRNMFSMPCTRRRSRRWSRPYSTLCFKYSCLKQLHMDTAACANTFRPSVSSSPICLQYWTIWVWTLVFSRCTMEHVVEILHLFTEPVVTLCENQSIFGSIALPNSVSFLNVFSMLFTYFHSNTVLINIKLLIKCQNSCQTLNNVHYVLLNIFTMIFLFNEIYCLLFHQQHCLFDNVSLWIGCLLSFHCLQFTIV